MARHNIKYNGMWACFNDSINSFITKFMSEEDYEKWRKDEYKNYSYISKLKVSNFYNMQDVVRSMRRYFSNEGCIKELVSCGLDYGDAYRLVLEAERGLYVPILRDDGKYECPNCGAVVEEGTEVCPNDYSCGIRFVWKG